MAGHSKFKNIQFRKDRQDALRSKLFSKFSRDITLAARQGLPDPAANSRLRLAIANAKAIYQKFREIFHGEPFAELRRQNVRVQRVLWGSTGTKNPAYSDVLYVEELIGPETISTIPLPTLKAFGEHGRVRGSIDPGHQGLTSRGPWIFPLKPYTLRSPA